MRVAILLLSGALLVAAPASARRDYAAEDKVKLAKALDGKSAGATRDCITLRDIERSTVVGSSILYKTGRKTLYRNDMVGGCRLSRHDPTLVNRVFGTRLCRGDVVSTIDLGSGFEGPHCVLGDFTLYQ